MLKKHIVTTFIKRRACATLVGKGDVEGDSPSLARDEVKGTRSPERLERCDPDELEGVPHMLRNLVRRCIHRRKERENPSWEAKVMAPQS